tara:strand:+ start:483 stop:692 length:210 start_codon:yes stop_codon:yes gene_type:complete
MKKLLLAISLIAFFGIGMTVASFTLPEDTNTKAEVKEGDDKKKKKKTKASCCKPEAKGKSCCKKPATES